MFYDRYISMCEEKHISPSAAAQAAGFNKGTVSVWKRKYEQGMDVDPDQDIIEKISAFFSVEQGEVRGLEQKEKPATQEGDRLTQEEWDIILRYRAASTEIRDAVQRVVGDGK